MKSFLIFLFLLSPFFVCAQYFNETEKKIVLSGDTSKMLRIIPLAEPSGEKALRSVSKDIAYNDPLLPLLKARMLKSVLDSSKGGVGIAAPQVGINRNLIWVQRFDKPGNPFEFFINPKIAWRSALLTKGGEGDLSFDGYGEVVRSYAIMISYTDMQGLQRIEMLEEFTAVIFQHETDHLYGTLFTDRMEEQKSKRFVPFQSVRSKELLTEEGK